MKTITGLITVVALLWVASDALPAVTSSGDGSELAIYIFLGMCALIVVVQLFPMLFMFYGLVKGMAHRKKEAVEVVEEVIIDK